jgi:hypothetical protein
MTRVAGFVNIVRRDISRLALKAKDAKFIELSRRIGRL